jgi:hypothetical protein
MLMKKLSVKTTLFITCCFINTLCKSQVYQWVDDTRGISYTIDIPLTSPVIRGIYFLVFPAEYNSGEVIDSWGSYPEIKDICTQNDLAFLGARINSCEIKEVFDEAMDHFATISHHPELRKLR